MQETKANGVGGCMHACMHGATNGGCVSMSGFAIVRGLHARQTARRIFTSRRERQNRMAGAARNELHRGERGCDSVLTPLSFFPKRYSPEFKDEATLGFWVKTYRQHHSGGPDAG
jgi:hypothetical protein